MDAVLKVVGTIGAIWLTVSILLAVAWALGGKRIFRKPPTKVVINGEPTDKTVNDVITELERRNRTNGRGL